MRARILLLGLDSAGKTTILYKSRLNESETMISTTGFNVDEVMPMRHLTFTLPAWRKYYKGSEGLIFVVDSSDVNHISDARDELMAVLKDEAIDKGVPLVILANKQDLPNALKYTELVDKMNLREIQEHPWHLQEVSALTGEGLHEGIHKLTDMVEQYRKDRKKRY